MLTIVRSSMLEFDLVRTPSRRRSDDAETPIARGERLL